MKNKKRIFSILLIMIISFGSVMTVGATSADADSEESDGETIASVTFPSGAVQNFIMTSSADVKVYQLVTDNSSYSSGEYERACSLLFVSSSPGTTVTLTKQTGDTVISGTYELSRSITDYTSASTYDYWNSFYSQFYSEGETYEDFIAYFEENPLYFYVSNYPYSWGITTGYSYSSSLPELSVYPMESDGSCKGEICSMLKLATNFETYVDWYYGFFYKNDPFASSGSGDDTGGGAGHEFAPDVSFYLTPKEYSLVSVLSQSWQCEWYLSWKNNDTSFDISDYTVEVYATSALLLDIKANISKYRPMISEREGDVSSKCVAFFNTTDLLSDDISVGSYITGYLCEDWRPKKNYPFHVLVRMVKDGVATPWTDFLCNPDGSISATYQRTTDMDLLESENLIGEDGNRTDGTAVDENGGSVSDQADTENAKKYGSDPFVETPEVDLWQTFKTLSELIDYLGQLPSLIARTLTFLPSEVLALISAGLTLFLIVGIIKFFK